MIRPLFATVAALALPFALGACSLFRAGDPIPPDAALNGDDGRLAALVDAIAQPPGAPALAEGAAMPAAAGRPATLQPAAPPAPVIRARSVLYALHLASYRTESSAEAGWRIIAREAADTLEDLHPRIETVDLGPERGVYLRLKAGPIDSRAEAAQRCATLVAEGHYCQTVDFEGREIPG